LSMYVSILTVAVPVNYTSEFRETFEASKFMRTARSNGSTSQIFSPHLKTDAESSLESLCFGGCCSGKPISITYSECVCMCITLDIQPAMRINSALRFYYKVPHYLIKSYDFI
jgi:hypothetical protein